MVLVLPRASATFRHLPQPSAANLEFRIYNLELRKFSAGDLKPKCLRFVLDNAALRRCQDDGLCLTLKLPAKDDAGLEMADYKVKFEVFEGPLDLLLYLIKKEEVDIYEVNLTILATQFIEYIETMRLLDLEVAGEFLVMAATLMYIKSRELLPVDQQVQTDLEDEGEDPRWELIRQLVEYKKFKDAAGRLAVLEERQDGVFPRVPGKLEFELEAPRRAEASIFDLLNAVNAVLQRVGERGDQRDIFEDKWSVSEKIEHLLRMLGERLQLKFSELFQGATSRAEVVATFLALLELIRLKQITAVQEQAFGEILICLCAPAVGVPAAAVPQAAAVGEPTAHAEIRTEPSV
jgi:segregation and condensation protein A